MNNPVILGIAGSLRKGSYNAVLPSALELRPCAELAIGSRREKGQA